MKDNKLYKKISKLKKELNQYKLSPDNKQELVELSQKLDELIVEATKRQIAIEFGPSQ
ncbi:Spo0E like sporulation regulatory protein [Halobacteroides halobius DSM 5150]|uniref:Spo0E like sporulation regulatory protein n=1 Tax=Halobacteroides halobius (strain ATCC 35273 / DSM 5150 / MD-1) TaxID=748449 RepID=L0K7M2_HALHC|nr:aspartyl-phosphate phosphatase Spo0E family protein [Halobacteroides halobius]AGB40550.1 Spo0E like sporulation regulatory protein [Halobacteroides halobius DSM 5150]